MQRKEMAGLVFGRLTVIKRGADKWYKNNGRDVPKVMWDCRCSCGNLSTQAGEALRAGVVVSCGCFNADKSRTHGMEGTRIYNVWASMLQRCRNPKHKSYHNYGGRGIAVCNRWYKFEMFYADMGEPSVDSVNGRRLTLDRIDNDKGYSPENCRWATYTTQLANRRGGNPGSPFLIKNPVPLRVAGFPPQ